MNFEESSPTGTKIISALGKALNFTLARSELIAATGLGVDAVRSALYRLKKKGFVFNPERGRWKLLKLYRKIRHCIRIVETRQANKKRSFEDCDAEATSEGFVPVTGITGALPPERPEQNTTKRYADVLSPKLSDALLVILARNDILFKSEGSVGIEKNDHPRLVKPFKFPKFVIYGTEWLEDMAPEFNDRHDVEVVFSNEQEIAYPTDRKTGDWYDRFYVDEDEF